MKDCRSPPLSSLHSNKYRYPTISLTWHNQDFWINVVSEVLPCKLNYVNRYRWFWISILEIIGLLYIEGHCRCFYYDKTFFFFVSVYFIGRLACVLLVSNRFNYSTDFYVQRVIWKVLIRRWIKTCRKCKVIN